MTFAAFTRPAPHLIVRGLLGEALAGRLLAHVQAREDAFVDSKVKLAEGYVDESIRRSQLLLDRSVLEGEVEARFRAQMEPAAKAFRLAPFTLDRLEMEFSAFGDGGYFRRHTDIGPKGSARRRVLTGVYYFHGRPKEFSGGELRLFGLMPEEQGARPSILRRNTTAWCCSPPGFRTRCCACAVRRGGSPTAASP